MPVHTQYLMETIHMIRHIRRIGFALLLVTLASCGGGDGAHNLKFSLILGQTSDWYRGAERFKALVEERTGGAYRITIYPDAQLAGQEQRTELEMVQSGVIDMSFESSILLSLIEPSMSVVSLPWLFDSYGGVNSVLDGDPGDELLSRLPEKGLVGLAWGANGFRQLTNNRNPVRTPEDMTAMKIRVPSIKMYIDIFQLLGADPSSMNFGELFTALAQGTMDGQENPLSVINSKRLYEVQDYLTIWNYSYDPIVLCMNRRCWESLDPDTQAIFSDCAREAMRYERGLVETGETALVDSLRTRGMTVDVPDSAALSAFKALAGEVYERYEPVIGGDLIQRFKSAAGGGVR